MPLRGFPNAPQIERNFIGCEEVLLEHLSRVGWSDGWRSTNLRKLKPHGIAGFDQAAKIVLEPGQPRRLDGTVEGRLGSAWFRQEHDDGQRGRCHPARLTQSSAHPTQAIPSHI